jgi:tripartite-type tricarboxylate transporter receptor subunit TctC
MKTLRALIFIALVGAPFPAWGDYPDRPVRLIVPFAPGGVADIVARLVNQKVAEQTGKQLFIENRTGAGGRIGYETGARANPDGYTFVITDVTYTMLPSLFEMLPWDHGDLVPVTLLGEMPFVVIVSAKAQANTLGELIAQAKASPMQLNYGSAGRGSVNHVVTELFGSIGGIQMTHVPYRGMGEAMNGLLGGSLDVMVTAMPTAMGNAKGGLVKALAVTSPRRAAALPDSPTATEVGVPFVASNWIGLTAPKGTPREAIEWVQKHFNAAVATPDVAARLAEQGVQPAAMSTSEFSSFMQQETKRWGDVIRSAKIKGQP